MLQMIRSSHLGTCCCKQTVHSTHTRTISNLHGCCGHTALLLLLKCALLSLFFLPSLSSFSFFIKTQRPSSWCALAVRYRAPWCCTECWTAPACVCWHTTLKLVCTSLHFPHGFQILSFFSSCTNRVLDSSTSSCVFRTECTGVQVCNTHARTHTHTHTAHSTQHTARAHTQHTHISHSHLFLFFLLSPTSSPPPPPNLPHLRSYHGCSLLKPLCFPCRFDSDAEANSRVLQRPSCWERAEEQRRRRRP